MLRFPKSLYGRFFLSLWAVTILTVGGGIGLTWLVLAERADPAASDSRTLLLEAARALDSGGEVSLVGWLRHVQSVHRGVGVFVIGPNGRDLLDRALPPSLAFALAHPDGGVGKDSPLKILPSQPLLVLVARDGRQYGIYLRVWRPPTQPMFRLLSVSDRYLMLLLALAVTAIASSLLTRAIARPVRALGQAARLLAGGALDTRVPAAVHNRRDELGILARDFDTMAIRLQILVQAREQLLCDVSHELRSPLARMRVALGLAHQSEAEVPAALERLDIEVSRLDRLIGQVLSLARLDSNVGPAGFAPIDLVELLESIVQDAIFEGQGRNVTVAWQATVETLLIQGRADWIASAVENVVRNALRYTEPGSSIEVALGTAADGVVIEVRDRGPGVPVAELARIFEPFYRVTTARGRDTGGDGIGLAIVARVLQLHGGHVTAAARTGGGLVIRLWLPRVGRPTT